jgi:putative methyltransferase (TIGR04325 family)
MTLAPIILFTYNRLDHTRQTVKALQGNLLASESSLYIYSDYARSENDIDSVLELRKYLNSVDGFKEVTVIERGENFGLSKSIINGVTQTLDKYENVIVLEDDLVTSKYFLKYMNDALEKYKNSEEVISIHGYVYPLEDKLPETFFLKGADCWGWATWKRGWNLFEKDGQILYDKLSKGKLLKEFNFNNSYPYSKMLTDQIAGSNNSWAIRWYASAFLANKLTLYPSLSLVQNIGLDNSGTHCSETDVYTVKMNEKEVTLFEKNISANEEAIEAFKKYFTKNHKIKSRVKRLIQAKTSVFKTKSKKHIKEILPPVLLKALKRKSNVWTGDYNNWSDASNEASGYDESGILEKVENATLLVRDGVYPYERDSVVFDKVQYSWPLLTSLLWVYTEVNEPLNIIDFGGSLGSTYYQNKKFISSNWLKSWNVIEQSNFVEKGRESFRDGTLDFYFNITDCSVEKRVDVVLISSVLQYLPGPYELIKEICESNVQYVLLDRLSIVEKEDDHLTIQNVPASIYKASYPCRFFSKKNILSAFSENFEVIEEFDAYILNEAFVDGRFSSKDKGFLLKRVK